ncbi:MULTISPECIES: hypothetical protein [Streptomyces violaceusniger group]|uniref:Uncharacterized protein n=1 Tax=Streptomyces rhizosphaericus TaxID=114699 RepID=A0ABP4DAD0_9ACTN|nr:MULTISPECIES: hypothetical protein [Streptomyces violaceusniger group]
MIDFTHAIIQHTKPISRDTPIPPEWGEHFNRESGFRIDVGQRYSMSVFLDSRFTVGGDAIRCFLRIPDQLLPRCISCLGEEWSVHTETKEEDRFGIIIIYTSKRKALTAGEGQVWKNGEVSFRVATLYDGITQAGNLSYGVDAKMEQNGNLTVTVNVKYADPRT